MKLQVLLLGAVVAAFSFTAFAADAPFSARAAANQPKVVSSTTETPANTLVYVDATSPTPISARAQANQTKVVKGTDSDANSTLACRKMSGGPKAINACMEHPGTMPGCNPVTVAPLK